MKIQELSKQIYDYLYAIKKPFNQRDAITALRWVIDMIEDGLTWEEIKQHLEEGCECHQIKSINEFEENQ